MNNATANNNGRQKRARIDETSNSSHIQPPKTTKKSPTKAASETLDRSVLSLPDALAPILHHFGSEMIQTKSRLFNKQSALKKMQDDNDYIPKSARASSFKITVSKATADANQNRLQFLQQQVEQAKNIYESSLKAIVIECTECEIAQLKQHVKNKTCETLKNVANAVITASNLECSNHQLVRNMIKAHYPSFKHCFFSNNNDLKTCYQLQNGLDILPQHTVHISPAVFNSEEARALDLQAQHQANQKPENKLLPNFKCAIESVILKPWSAYLDQQEINKKEIILKKMTTEIVHEKKTEDAAMALENEEAANMEQLKDLVRQETEKKYKSLEQKYNTLLQKVEDNLQKNVTSRDQSGASGKKKYNNTQQKVQ